MIVILLITVIVYYFVNQIVFHPVMPSVEHKKQSFSMCKCPIYTVSKVVSGEALWYQN